MIFIKYSILIMAIIGSVAGLVIGIKSLPGYMKNCKANSISSFILLPFVFSPLSQTIYALILGVMISGSVKQGQDQAVTSKAIVIGLVIGLIFLLVACGKAYLGKKACRIISNTGQGFNKYMMINGFVETISIFALVFGMIALKLG